MLRTAKSARDPSINQKLGRVSLVIFRRRQKKRGHGLSTELPLRFAMLANSVSQTNTGRSECALTSGARDTRPTNAAGALNKSVSENPARTSAGYFASIANSVQ